MNDDDENDPCDSLLRIGDDSTPEVSKVRDLRGNGSITSGNRDSSEAYQKFLSRARGSR